MPKTYYPHPELKPLKTYPLSVRVRIGVERAICRRAVRGLHAMGYALRVHSGDDWETPRGADEAALMRALFNLDDAWLVAYQNGARKGWVRFVFGNEGWDAICDYTTDLEPALAPAIEYAERLSG